MTLMYLISLLNVLKCLNNGRNLFPHWYFRINSYHTNNKNYQQRNNNNNYNNNHPNRIHLAITQSTREHGTVIAQGVGEFLEIYILSLFPGFDIRTRSHFLIYFLPAIVVLFY